jgi:hypothetical protein
MIAGLLAMQLGTSAALSETEVLATYTGGAVTFRDVQVSAEIAGTPLEDALTFATALRTLENRNSQIYNVVTDIAFYNLIEKEKDPKSLVGISREALKLASRLALQAYARSIWSTELSEQVTLSEQDYEKGQKLYAEQISAPGEAKVAYLFVENPEKFPKAKALLDEWRGKADFTGNFENYARKARELAGTALTGGMIEEFVAGKYNPQLDAKVFSVPVGKVSEPFSTPKGMFVIKVLERKERGMLPDAEVKAILTSLLSREKLAALEKQKLEELRKRHKTKEWSGTTVPTPETIIAVVDGTELRLSTLFEAYPQKKQAATTDPKSLATTAKDFVDGELIVGDVTERMGKEDASLMDKLKLFEERSYALELLKRLYERPITAAEEEAAARAYYEKHKGIYHAPTPKTLLALVFHMPTEEKEPSRVVREKITRQLRDVAEKFAKSTTSDTFDDDAKNLIDEVKEKGKYVLTLDTLGPYEVLPAGWQSPLQLDQMMLRKVSPLVTTGDSFVVFQVVEELPYRILPYEEVREQPMSVVLAQKQEEMRNKLKAEVLAAGDFKIVSAESK